MEELLKELELNDLKGRSREMAEAIGMDAFCKMIIYYGGTDPYIPDMESVLLPVRNKMINRAFDGFNSVELSRKWGLTERYIREIVKEQLNEIRNSPSEDQISLFG